MLIRSWTFRKDFHFFLYELSSEPKTELKTLLCPDELKHFKNIKNSERAQSFLASRARLRQNLAGFLSCDPSSLQISQNAQGKLFLSSPATDLSFSISHSGDRLLIAICTSGAFIGIDLESTKTDADLELIARGFFTDEEKYQLQSLPVEERRTRILEIWCLKEARFKMQGNSLQQSNNEQYEIHYLDQHYIYAFCYHVKTQSAEQDGMLEI